MSSKVDNRYVLSFDVGTSALKAILLDQDGNIHEMAQAEYDVIHTRQGWVEFEAADWWKAATTVSRDIMMGTDVPPEQVEGMVFSTQVLNIIPMDANGNVLRNGISWMDGRADIQAQQIIDMMGGPEAALEMAGTVLTGMDAIPKLLWLAQNEPHIFEKMKHPLDCNGYMIYRATGKMVYDTSSASVLAYDPETEDFAAEFLAVAGLDPDNMPRVVKSYEKVGNLTKEAAHELGLTTKTAVFGGMGDMQGAAIGSGKCAEGEPHIYLGSSGWAAVPCREVKPLSSGGAVIMSADPEMHLWVYESETACAAHNWFLDNFYTAEQGSPLIPNVYEFTDALSMKIPPGCDGVLFNPWLTGERSPLQDIYARGAFFNLTINTTRLHMLRAVLESIPYNLRWVYESLEFDLGKKSRAVRIMGGGTRSPVWMQMFADIFNRDIEVVDNSQHAGAIGAAVAAAIGLGAYDTFEEGKKWARVSHVYHPNAENVPVYEEMFHRFKRTYEITKDAYHDWNREEQ